MAPTPRAPALEILLKFLERMPDSQIRVMMTPHAREANLTIVGDWFSAESMSPKPGEGHRQTVFTWHAPSVLQSMRRFDDEFNELLGESGVQSDETRRAAIQRIGEMLKRKPE